VVRVAATDRRGKGAAAAEAAPRLRGAAAVAMVPRLRDAAAAVVALHVRGAAAASSLGPRPAALEHSRGDRIGQQVVADLVVMTAVVLVHRPRLGIEDGGGIKELLVLT
jgi:hypothetical protein